VTVPELLQKIEDEEAKGNTALSWMDEEVQKAVEGRVPAPVLMQGLAVVKRYLKGLSG
jgi:hypothetical protein